MTKKTKLPVNQRIKQVYLRKKLVFSKLADAYEAFHRSHENQSWLKKYGIEFDFGTKI